MKGPTRESIIHVASRRAVTASPGREQIEPKPSLIDNRRGPKNADQRGPCRVIKLARRRSARLSHYKSTISGRGKCNGQESFESNHGGASPFPQPSSAR